MIVYILKKDTIFLMTSGRKLTCNLQEVSLLVEEGIPIIMHAFPLNDHPYLNGNGKLLEVLTTPIKSMISNPEEGFYDVFTASGTHYRLLI